MQAFFPKVVIKSAKCKKLIFLKHNKYLEIFTFVGDGNVWLSREAYAKQNT